MTRDIAILFATRGIRLFAYGFVSVVLVLYLSAAGVTDNRIGTLLTLTLIGDVVISLILTTQADLLGRRRTLVGGALLMIGAGVVFAMSHNYILLVLAATIGVISPSGNEVGPFLAVEQVALAQTTPASNRTSLFAWYQLAGSVATALGSLAAGALTSVLSQRGFSTMTGYRSVIVGYGLLGVALAALFARLTTGVESSNPRGGKARRLLNIDRSRGIVARLAALFALDSFAGGFVLQSMMAWWFHHRFGLSPLVLGAIFFGANLLAGVSALAAAGLARRIGLINTMVFTHLPSNVLLILVPFMPRLDLAIGVLLLRFSISQMDVPTRQSFVMAVVDESERTAAAGITGVARTTGAALAPIVAMPLFASTHDWLPFVVAGGLKIVYDLVLLVSSRKVSIDG
jgi:MFS family permease